MNSSDLTAGTAGVSGTSQTPAGAPEALLWKLDGSPSTTPAAATADESRHMIAETD